MLSAYRHHHIYIYIYIYIYDLSFYFLNGQTCTEPVEVNDYQTAEGSVTLSWSPPCTGQLWMDGRLLVEGVEPPYVVTGLPPQTYIYGLFGRRAWAFSGYSVMVVSPFVPNNPTTSPTANPTSTPSTIGESRDNVHS